MCATSEMPSYKSHKEVWAFKIKSIKRDGEGENRETDGSAMITPEEEGFPYFPVSAEYMHKHKPEVGGYYVVYKDGYKSFSPAKAFEEGNTLIEKITGIDEVLGKLQEARALLNDEAKNGVESRELSIVITKIDEALLWRSADNQRKKPPINEKAGDGNV